MIVPKSMVNVPPQDAVFHGRRMCTHLAAECNGAIVLVSLAVPVLQPNQILQCVMITDISKYVSIRLGF